MISTRFLGLVCISLAMFALPAAAQTPDGMTPSREDKCDDLAFATPGLKGLCVAMCEAQDCEGIYDPVTEQVTFDPSCNPSSYSLFANYIKKASPDDPPLPCIRVACPCWTESEIDNIGGLVSGSLRDSCIQSGNTATLFGFSTDGSGAELAYALENGHGLECIYMEGSTQTFRDKFISAEEFRTCRDSVLAEIASRELTCIR